MLTEVPLSHIEDFYRNEQKVLMLKKDSVQQNIDGATAKSEHAEKIIDIDPVSQTVNGASSMNLTESQCQDDNLAQTIDFVPTSTEQTGSTAIGDTPPQPMDKASNRNEQTGAISCKDKLPQTVSVASSRHEQREAIPYDDKLYRPEDGILRGNEQADTAPCEVKTQHTAGETFPICEQLEIFTVEPLSHVEGEEFHEHEQGVPMPTEGDLHQNIDGANKKHAETTMDIDPVSQTLDGVSSRSLQTESLVQNDKLARTINIASIYQK